jgi:hypothetical protein
MMITQQSFYMTPTFISAPREGVRPCLIPGAERISIECSNSEMTEFAIRHSAFEDDSRIWLWLEHSGMVIRHGRRYNIWYVTRTEITRRVAPRGRVAIDVPEITRRVVAEYVIEDDTNIDDFMIVVRNDMIRYADGAEDYTGKRDDLNPSYVRGATPPFGTMNVPCGIHSGV